MKPLNISPRLSRDFPPEARYLVGVSGGRDSVALLHWLVNLDYEKLIVCHLNHQLRGRMSDADARFVKSLAGKYELYFEFGRRGRARSLQRKRRSRSKPRREKPATNSFAKTARRRKCKTIFLAHHADDLVETFLINLFRGAGSTGLAGIREISTRRIDKFELTIVRPFLHVWREEISDYVREHGLRFREDATNKNLDPLRNRIRHQIIPYLEKALSRNIRATIWRTAAIAAEEEHWMENDAFPLQQVDVTAVTENCGYLLVGKLRELPVALQRRAILKWLRAQNIAGVGFDVIERVRSLADRDAHTAKVNLPQDRHARRRAGKIFVE